MTQEELFKKLIAHCKEYGFVFQSSEIYDGLSAVYDYGQNGAELKRNIRDYWWKAMVQLNDNIVGLDDYINPIKEKRARLFVQEKVEGNPPADGKGTSTDDVEFDNQLRVAMGLDPKE